MQNAIERLERAERLEASLATLRREAWEGMNNAARTALENAQTDAAIAAENALLELDEAGDKAAA